MTTLSLTDPVGGTTTDATLIANNNAALKTVVNGAIDATNLSNPGAGKVWGSSGAAAAAVNPPGYEWAQAALTTNLTIAGTAAGAPTTVVTLSSVSYDGAAVWFEAIIPSLSMPGASFGVFDLWDNTAGVCVARIGQFNSGATAGASIFGGTLKTRYTPAAGARVFSLRAYASAATGVVLGNGVAGGDGTFSTYLRAAKA